MQGDHVPRPAGLPWTLWLFASGWIALAIYWQWLLHRDGIFGEMWDTLPAFQQLGQLTVPELLRELYRKYAYVHILALPKLGFWADFEWFGASGRFTRACSFLFMAGSCLLAWKIAVMDFQRPVACAVLALLLFFNGCQSFVINWESLLQYYLAIFFTLLAFLLFGLRPGRLLWPAVCLLCAGLSCGSSIAGLIGFTCMLLLRLREGWVVPRTALAGFALFLVVMGWLLIPDPITGFLIQDPLPFFWNAPSLLWQIVAYPFSAWGDARWLGVLVTAVVVHSVWCCLLRRGSLSDFVLATFFLLACSVAYGRYKVMPMEADVMRYYGFITPVWYFGLLMCLKWSGRLFAVIASVVSVGIVSAGLVAVTVAANQAHKMEMARMVALAGNVQHFARQRMDAYAMLPANMENSRDYLRANGMDIYHDLPAQIVPVPAPDTCAVTLLRERVVTKGTFVDYVLQEQAGNPGRVEAVYLASPDGVIHYYGTPFAAVAHLDGWGIQPRQVRIADWPLLLPVSQLPLSRRRLFVHLPRSVEPESLVWWGALPGHRWCRLVFEGETFAN